MDFVPAGDGYEKKTMMIKQSWWLCEIYDSKEIALYIGEFLL